jgi:hypothetical protein
MRGSPRAWSRFSFTPATPLILIAASAEHPIKHQAILLWHNVHMSDERILTLRQADRARTDFALIESNLEFIAGELAKQPTRGDLAKAALGIIFCTAVFTTLFVWIVWH